MIGRQSLNNDLNKAGEFIVVIKVTEVSFSESDPKSQKLKGS